MAAQVTVFAPSIKPPSSRLAKSQPGTWQAASSEGLAVRHDRSQSQDPTLHATTNSIRVPQAVDTSAKSVQFVACPGQTQELRAVLPAAIQGAFGLDPSFAGSMVLVAIEEARRVTIITFWKGPEGAHPCAENTERLRMRLFPYVDHWLRSEDHVAHLSLNSGLEKQSIIKSVLNEVGSTVNA